MIKHSIRSYYTYIIDVKSLACEDWNPINLYRIKIRVNNYETYSIKNIFAEIIVNIKYVL